MFTSIRFRLTLSHLAVVVVAMLLSSFLLLSTLERYFIQSVEDSLTAQARITAQTLIPGSSTSSPGTITQAPAYNAMQNNTRSGLSLQAQNAIVPSGDLSKSSADLTYLSDASLQLSSALDTRIRIVDAQGTVLVDSQGSRGISLMADELVSQGLNGHYASRVIPASSSQKSSMLVALPVLVDQKVAGVVYLSQSLDDVTQVLYDVRYRLLFSTLIALLLTGIISSVLSGAITRPIRELTHTAEAIKGNWMEARAPVKSTDEIGRLGLTFNQMMDRLKAAQQMQVDFIANVSHELRTPLTSIKGMTETLRDGAVDDLEVRDRFLQVMENETDRLIRLVNDLLLITRADSKALELDLQPVRMQELVRQAAEQMQPQAGGRQVTFKIIEVGDAIQDEHNKALVDPDRIKQVLTNLFSNAIQYSSSGDEVEVSLEYIPGANRIQVGVRDHGPGIPPDELQRIGQRFYRADKARSRSEGGSGLGISIARALVMAHGGNLWLKSEEGQGTVAFFSVPSTRD